jgi:hypothetical protein
MPDNDRMAIGFWMRDEGAQPHVPIWVLATYEALAQIDPSQVRDTFGARTIFDENRARIEAAASKKFDTEGADDGEHEGQPILMIRSDDIPDSST